MCKINYNRVKEWIIETCILKNYWTDGLQIKSVRIALFYTVIQLIINSSIILSLIFHQEHNYISKEADSIATTKITGKSVTNFSQEEFQIKNDTYLYNRVWDSSEYTIPNSENMGFFITTNVIITPNQTIGICPEDTKAEGPNYSECNAGSSNNLENDSRMSLGNAHANSEESWCPEENTVFPLKNSRAVLEKAENYTVTIFNSIHFTEFGSHYKRDNINQKTSACELRTCLYNETTDPLCPNFRVKDLVEMAGEKFSEMALRVSQIFAALSTAEQKEQRVFVMVQSTTMSITISWNCNLNHDFMEECLPKYSIRRLDMKNSSLSGGWNFKLSHHHEFRRRTLYNLYGIKFLIDVSAEGRVYKIPSLLSIMGGGLAILQSIKSISDYLLPFFINLSNKDKDGSCTENQSVGMTEGFPPDEKAEVVSPFIQKA